MKKTLLILFILVSSASVRGVLADRTFSGLGVFGDSLTAEGMPWGRTWPDFLRETIVPPGGAYENLAQGGASSAMALGTISGYVAGSPNLDPGRLYAIFVGTNDGSGYAGNVVEGVNALHRAGAGYILVSNLHDCPRRSPRVISAFNNDLNNRLRGTAANVIMVDTNSLIKELTASPAAYGYGSDPVLADGLHFTQRTSSILAQYFNSVIQAPVRISLLPEFPGYVAYLNNVRLESLVAYPAVADDREYFLFADLGVNFLDIRAREEYAAADLANYGILLGGYRWFLDNLKAGAGLNIATGSGELGPGQGDFKMTNYIFSLFAEWDIEELVPVTLILSRGWYDLDNVTRPVNLGSQVRKCRGSTSAASTSLAVKGRYRALRNEQAVFGPSLGLDYAAIKVDGYTESGDLSTTMRFGSQETDRAIVSAGLFSDYHHEFPRSRARLFARADYLHTISGSSRTLEAGVAAFDVKFESPAYSPGDYGALRLALGGDLILPSGVTGTVGYQFLYSDVSSIHSIRLGLRYGFGGVTPEPL